jgi:uncharacterized protein HemY
LKSAEPRSAASWPKRNPDSASLAQPCRKDTAEALRLSRQAVQEVPSKNGYYNTLGLAEYRNDLWNQAIISLHRSIELDAGTDPTDFFFLAMAH